MQAVNLLPRHRKVVQQTEGHGSGPIKRLMSPSDLGEALKPFVFLDLATFEGDERMPMDLLWHPHSGIATVTVMLEGGVQIAETTGKTGILPKGSVEFMQAGNGVWHTGQAAPGTVKAFQLWLALPRDLENGPATSHYVMPDDVPSDGRVRVILGSYQGMTSPIAPVGDLTYLVVTLEDGERWTYTPSEGHDVAFVAVSDGALRTSSEIGAGELALFEGGSAPLDFVGRGATRFVIGSARKHPYELSLGYYSVHTSPEALATGEAEIRRIGRELAANGTLKRAIRV
jgi:redox-sensitive bicupin YhaK (pirin superfamily)